MSDAVRKTGGGFSALLRGVVLTCDALWLLFAAVFLIAPGCWLIQHYCHAIAP